MLKEPFQWILGENEPTQPGLDLTWPLSFERRGRQGRVRAKVRKMEDPPADGPRRLRPRTQSARPPISSDDEDDEDYDDQGMASMSEDEEEDVSEFVET